MTVYYLPSSCLRSIRICRVTILRFISFLVVAPLAALAQSGTGTVEGRVLNPATGDYVLNVQVSLKGTESEQERVVQVGSSQTVRENFELTSQSRYGGAGQTVNLSAYTVAATREMDARAVASLAA